MRKMILVLLLPRNMGLVLLFDSYFNRDMTRL